MNIEQTTEAHHCKCNKVERCAIFTHPSPKIQKSLNALMDLLKDFDDRTGSKSTLAVESKHPAGVFTSITKNLN